MVVRVNGRLVQKQFSFLTDGDIHALGVLNVRSLGLPIAVVGQPTTGHGGFPSTISIQGSPNVRITGLPVVRAGDAYAPHTDGSSTHTGFAAPI